MSPRLPPHERALRNISELDWQRTVQGLLDAHGWLWFHSPRPGVRRDNRFVTVTKGWPDIAAVRGHRLLFAELKRQTGKTTPAQDEWLEALAAAGADVHVWRPSDLDSVREVLA